ncbi:non-ribosomal peptide synthetase [Streptomyces sclerotialus]|uniref:non-ribosomal peptide synthetase n=1 Tax=Streptomyces sclerotialus TaxID=1957 RepID=UPI0004C5F8B5
MTAQQQTSVTEAIGNVVRDHPERPALESANGVISYREFGERIDKFTAQLDVLTAPDEFIGIEAVRTAGSIIAMAGALKAGRPFVFLDPRDSVASNRTKVSSLGVRMVATTPAGTDAPQLEVARDEWRAADVPNRLAAAGEITGGRDRIGYAIHTSGSTGEPKCVLVRVGPLAPMIRDHVRVLEVDTRTRTLQFARLTFDGCITEILWTLTGGGCLVVLDEARLGPGPVLQGTLEQYGITHLKTTPFALTATEPTDAMRLRHVINGGGACRQAVVQKWSSRTAFHNAYGTTETTVCNFLTGVLDPADCADSVPLGDVVGDCGYEVVPLPAEDGAGTTVPAGARGELVITGESVAIGYLTAEGLRRFADGDGNRVYRTGDIVELRDGQVHFVERLDRQLKVRGYRIDPGEVEIAACRVPSVVEAVVTAEAHESTEGGADALVCYYQGAASSREVRAHLEKTLDAYKVPSVIKQIDTVPYTRNGKVDRDALRASRAATSAATAAAAGPDEQVLALVRQLTGVDDVALDDNFFEVGGDSASAVILVNKLKELGWMDAGVRDILRADSLRTLTDELRDRSV